MNFVHYGIYSDTPETHLPATNNLEVMLAAYHGHSQLVGLLIAHGANPNSLNDRGQSPLAGAVFKNESEVVKVI